MSSTQAGTRIGPIDLVLELGDVFDAAASAFKESVSSRSVTFVRRIDVGFFLSF